MKSTVRALSVVALVLCTADWWSAGAGESPVSDSKGSGNHPLVSHAVGASLNSASQDDLSWLVGRWRCYVRRYRDDAKGPLGAGAEDTLDYFNVYFPYADDQLTLRLTDAPQDRPIAAEFLVRRIDSNWLARKDDKPRFRDMLFPLSPSGPIGISRNLILIGGTPNPGSYGFHYQLVKRGHELWLVLESKVMHLELLKISSEIEGIKDSFVDAPIRDYSPERIQELKRQYGELTKRFQSASISTAAPDQTSAKAP